MPSGCEKFSSKNRYSNITDVCAEIAHIARARNLSLGYYSCDCCGGYHLTSSVSGCVPPENLSIKHLSKHDKDVLQRSKHPKKVYMIWCWLTSSYMTSTKNKLGLYNTFESAKAFALASHKQDFEVHALKLRRCK